MAFCIFEILAFQYIHHRHLSLILLAVVNTYIICASAQCAVRVLGGVAHLFAVDDKHAVYNSAVVALSFYFYLHGVLGLLIIGYWLLVTGYWLLVTVNCFFVVLLIAQSSLLKDQIIFGIIFAVGWQSVLYQLWKFLFQLLV